MLQDRRQKELLENDVKDAKETTHSIPLHDYRPALQGAVSWLGDRYLLAEPVRRRNDTWHPVRLAAAQPARATGDFLAASPTAGARGGLNSMA